MKGEELKLLIRRTGLTITEAADKIGVTRQTLHNKFGMDEVDEDFLLKVKERLSGDTSSNLTVVKEGLTLYENLAELKVPKTDLIPFYDVDVAAGYPAVRGEDVNHAESYLWIPGFEDCDCAATVRGDSMYPKYSNGDIILCKRVPDLRHVRYGEPYLIIDEDGQVVKYITKDERKGYFLLASENPNPRFAPYSVPVTRIRWVFLVKGVIKRTA